MKPCSIEGCKNKAARPNDWCHTHYDRYLRTGSPLDGAKDGLRDRIKALLPGESMAIAAKLGENPHNVQVWIRKMRNARQVYVSKWRRPDGKGRHIATYALGDKPDAQCKLARKSREAIWKSYRAKLIRSGEIEIVRARQLARYYADRAKAKPNTWLGALGVRA
jgi:hypothetical protein